MKCPYSREHVDPATKDSLATPALAFWAFVLAFILSLGAVRPGSSAEFVRGDVDSSSRLDVSDAIRILNFLFAGAAGAVTCEDAADVDDDGNVIVTDAVSLLGALFQGGPLPAAPFPGCGPDPTEDALGCEAEERCRFAFEFFGASFAADGVIFVIDRSPPGVALTRGKEEVIRVLDSFLPDARFAIVFFDAGILRHPREALAPAGAEEIESAKALVSSMSRGAGTCPLSALIAALSYLEDSPARNHVILHVTDGAGTCQGADEAQYLEKAVEIVSAANQGRARIHTFGVGPLNPLAERHLMDLAVRNGGQAHGLQAREGPRCLGAAGPSARREPRGSRRVWPPSRR